MIRDIPLEEIRPNPKQPRKHFTGIEELAESLTTEGQFTPALVRPIDGGFEIVQGERRYRAAERAGLDTLRAEIRELDDAEAFKLSLLENMQRENLTPTEEAEAFRHLLDAGMTQAEVGETVGKSQSYVAHKLRLLRAPAPIQVLVGQNAISEGHARQLLRLEGLYPPDAVCDDWKKTVDATDVKWQDPLAINAMLAECRPEQDPPALLCTFQTDLSHTKNLSVLQDSLVALLEYVTNHNHSIHQWALAAWWWGTNALISDWSVTELKLAIDRWWDRFTSCAWEIWMRDNPPDGDERNATWWLAFADLEHSNCGYLRDRSSLSKADKKWWSNSKKGAILNVWEAAQPGNSIILPSAMQEWGTHRDIGRRINNRRYSYSEDPDHD